MISTANGHTGLLDRLAPFTPPQTPAAPLRYQRITSRELAGGKYQLEFLIEGALVKGQPLLIGGSHKTLKTSAGIIAAGVALASGTRWLGHFDVPRPVRVAIMSGESGPAVLQETAKRICAASDVRLDDLDNLIWSPELPKFGDASHLIALEDFLAEDGAEVVFIDPAYLCMPGADAGNLMRQGELLRGVSELCQRLGVTMALAHHTKKSTGKGPYDIPELGDLAWAGFAEWARQWWLLGRRERFQEGTGSHRLWMTIGGSAGHSDLRALDIEEGRRSDPSGRRWVVDLRSSEEANRGAAREQEQRANRRRFEQAKERVANDKETVLATMAAIGQPETAKTIRAHAGGMPNDRLTAAISALRKEGKIEAAPVTKPNRKTPYEGLRLKVSEVPS